MRPLEISRSLRERSACRLSDIKREAGAEGETAPETLRQKDRRGMKLWKAAARKRRSPTE